LYSIKKEPARNWDFTGGLFWILEKVKLFGYLM
jgi:hypothetical protein